MSHAVATFGRFNAPTETGHGKLIGAVQQHAESIGAKHYIFPSHTQDPKKNPLSHGDKVGFMRRLFPDANVVSHKGIRNGANNLGGALTKRMIKHVLEVDHFWRAVW